MTSKLFTLTLVLAASFALSQTPSPHPAPATASTATPMQVGGGVLPPVLIHTVEPRYPRPLFHKPKPSTVLVRITVAVDGSPANLQVIQSGGPTFDKSALAAVSQYRFQPATLQGKPVPVEINLQVQFRIF